MKQVYSNCLFIVFKDNKFVFCKLLMVAAIGFAIVIFTQGKANAETEGCEVGDYSMGKWEYVKNYSNNNPSVTCSLPMSGPIDEFSLMMVANGYQARIAFGYNIGCDNSGYCSDGHFIGSAGDGLKTLEKECQSMYYPAYEKKYENGCCYVREHATYGDWLPFFGLYQYGYNLQKWVCFDQEKPKKVFMFGPPPSECDL